MSIDVDQLTDSMRSITFDQPTTLSSAELMPLPTHAAHKAHGRVVFMPVEDQFSRALQAFSDDNDVGGPAESGQIVFSCAGEDATAVSQTPMTLASTAGVSFSQHFPFQPSMVDSFATTALEPNDDDTAEQYGCVNLQDMLDNDYFS